MVIRYLRHATFIAALIAFTAAQGVTIIPDDLQTGFRPDGDEVQVSFTGDAVNGFKDGTVFEKDAVEEEPTFALGDSSGISSTTLYTIIMVDTTCPNSRKLHYARANFKYNFDITNINTSSPALLDYIAPSSLGEKGDNRQYSFLMYMNPGRKEISDLQLPEDNDAFDITQFQDNNGLGDAMAGVGMVVKLGGDADCAGGNAEALPSSLPTPRPAKSTGVVVSRTSSPENATAGTTLTRDISSAATPTPMPASSRSPANSVIPSPSNLPSPEAASSATVSTIVLSSADGTGSSTAATTAAEQTANAALGSLRCQSWGVASLLAIVSLISL
ncbi:hypothetical protein G6011_07882 [Alternaria panax]|uniref:Uncharacterized protein n=1 Tax=Alternaria panax TaxID=48097 RepID=A0AAD4I4D7_9PLEO|nr:hypothetical protein G6011_07882 [Alternaria panax]